MKWDRFRQYTSAKTGTAAILLIISVCILNWVIRVSSISSPGLDIDESATWMLSQSIRHLIPALVIDCHPPLYFILQSVWTTIFGTSELALRLPSTLFSFLTLLLLAQSARIVDSSQRIWFMAGVLLIFSLLPYDIHLSRFARSYSLLVLLCSLFSYFLFRAIVMEERRYLVHAAIIGIASLYTHSLALIYAVSAFGASVLASPTRANFKVALKIGIVMAIAYIPWAFTMPFQIIHNASATRLFQALNFKSIANIPVGRFLTLLNPYPSSLDSPIHPVHYGGPLAVPGTILEWIGLAIAITAFGLILLNLKKIIRVPLMKAFLFQVALTLMLMAISPIPLLNIKTISIFLFPMILLLGFSLGELAQTRWKALSVTFLGLFIVVSLAGFPHPNKGSDWKAACKYIADAWKKSASSALIISPSNQILPLQYQVARSRCCCFNPVWTTVNQPVVLLSPYSKLLDVHLLPDPPSKTGKRRWALDEEALAEVTKQIVASNHALSTVFFLRAGEGDLKLSEIEQQLPAWRVTRKRFGYLALYHLESK